MHLFESSVGETVFNRIVRELFTESVRLSGDHLYRKFKKVVGKIHAKDFFENWVWQTGCPEFHASYRFNRKSNSLELSVT